MKINVRALLTNVVNDKDFTYKEIYLDNEYIYLDMRFGYIIRFKLESDDDSKLRCVGIFKENEIDYFIFKKEGDSNLLLCKNDGILKNGDKIICLSTRFEVGDYIANARLAGIVKLNIMGESYLEYAVNVNTLLPEWETVHTDQCYRLATEDEIKAINEFKEVFSK